MIGQLNCRKYFLRLMVPKSRLPLTTVLFVILLRSFRLTVSNILQSVILLLLRLFSLLLILVVVQELRMKFWRRVQGQFSLLTDPFFRLLRVRSRFKPRD